MLNLSLFGTFELHQDERPLPPLTSQKAQALLVYLAVEARQIHQRDKLMSLFWPDYPQKSAQQSLRQTLYLLRQTLQKEERDPPLILAERFTVTVNRELLSLDIDQFAQMSENGRSPQAWQQAADLYRGHFLADFYLPDSEPFEEWVANKRAFYQRRMQALLQRLAHHYLEMGDDGAAETAVRRQLSLDNLQEAAHRQLMEIWAKNGRRQEALTHYDNLYQLLQTELGIEPETETLTLVAAIRTGEVATQTPALISHHQPKQPRHNLPHLITSFIGRQKELTEITTLITHHRLLTLTGVGGIGKTTLSVQVGHHLLENFPDGVWLVALAPIMDETLVPQTVLYALGLRDASNRPILEVVLEFLQEKTALLILDNCEHLLQSTAQFAQSALQSCPKLTILATSREIFDMPGERPFAIPSLSMPKNQQLPALDQWQNYEAMRLFVARATTVLPQYQVTQGNLAPLVQICQQLDGIPLALELAAAKVTVLTTEQIASGLTQRFRLLATGNRGALPRHQTLQALVDWSWELLAPEEQVLWQCLSVFTGGMTLTAVTAVCSDNGLNEIEVLNLLTQLVNKSLLIAERQQGQEVRYRLLETIRQYGAARLAETDQVGKLRQRHLDYFLQWGEQTQQKLIGAEQVGWLGQLEAELENLRTTLALAQQIDVEAGLRLSIALWKFWEARGYAREGESWIANMLEQAADINQHLKAKALGVQSDLLFKLSSIDLARHKAEECLILYRELDDLEGIAFGIHRLVCLLDNKEDGVTSIFELLAESLSIYRTSNNQLGVAESLEALAMQELGKTDFTKAKEYLAESLSIYQQIGHLAGIGAISNLFGRAALWQGNYAEARVWTAKAAIIMARLGTGGGVWTLMTLGTLDFRLGNYEQARNQLEQCLILSQRTGEKRAVAWALAWLGYVFLRMGKLGQAWQILIESQENFIQVGELSGVTFALEGIASLAVQREQAERAVQFFAWADATREAIEDIRPPIEQADVDRDVAFIKEMIGEEAYAGAYAQGKKMTMEEVMALAVAVRGE